MKENNFSRTELYNLVWDHPISKLAKTFNLDPQRVKDICVENKIPLPYRAYWSKVRFNKKVDKTSLPKMENSIAHINLNSGPKTRKFRTDYHQRAYELEQRKELKFIVPGSISIYHPMVKSSKKLLEKIDESEDRLKFWQLSREKDILPIHTDKTLRARALRFMDTLIRIEEAMGHKKTFEYSRCHVEMFGQMTKINLRQKVYRTRDKYESGWGRESWKKSDKLEFLAGPSFRQKSGLTRINENLRNICPK